MLGVKKTILVTGGAGFIGSALVRHLIAQTSDHVHVVDKLTYAGTLTSLDEVASHSRFGFSRVDICDADGLSQVMAHRHLYVAASCTGALGKTAVCAARLVSISSCVNGRSVRFSWRNRLFY